MTDLIHVRAYTKDDGTNVKEHYRGRGVIAETNEIIQESRDDNYSHYGINPYTPGGFVMYASDEEDPTVLTGGVEKTQGEDDHIFYPSDDDDDEDGEPEKAIPTLFDLMSPIIINALKFAYGLNEGNDTQNPKNYDQYKKSLDASIKNMDLMQNALKTQIDKDVDKLVKTKDQKEYEKLYKSFVKKDDLHLKNNQAIKNIKIASATDNYKEVIEELRNYQSNFDEVTSKNREERPLESQMQELKPLDMNSIHYVSNPVPTPFINSELPAHELTTIDKRLAIDGGMLLANGLTFNTLKDTKELWKASSHDFKQSADYMKENANMLYSTTQLPSKELQQIVQEKLQEQLGVKDAMGAVFRADSTLSQAIVNSKEFKTHIQQNLDKLLQGQVIKEASTHFTSNKNLRLALGHADILYTMLDENGNLYATVLDTYDFNPKENIIIQQARDIQEARIIRNYYTLNVIFVPKYQLEGLLNVRL